MKCKDIERLIVDSSEDVLSPKDLSEIEQHVSKCAKCTRFQEDVRKIRLCLDETTTPEPSVELVKQTQLLCHAKLKTRDASDWKSVDQT
ncbi:MAG: zf-HC2 domain-containing protein, partial [Candidatus Aminicenantes bacterium]